MAWLAGTCWPAQVNTMKSEINMKERTCSVVIGKPHKLVSTQERPRSNRFARGVARGCISKIGRWARLEILGAFQYPTTNLTPCYKNSLRPSNTIELIGEEECS